ncbi:hypothetical protein P12x_003808 [Tundrisphaera lichenicola]|uniref:hypothetical protein n=1 Tax=Tundrisphaera lichenicola TaxID=2029860 RepID=UPI003EBD10BA
MRLDKSPKMSLRDQPDFRIDPGIDQDSLIRLLGGIMRGLEGDIKPGASRDTLVNRWEDDENVYIEIQMPIVPAKTMDICVTNGVVFVRLDR